MSNSSLISYTKISPNKNTPRHYKIDRITPHCVVGQFSAEAICKCFESTSRQASCNYGIGADGRIALCVDEGDRSWCSSSGANDHRAVTIECASDTKAPYAMNDAVFQSLINLCEDICKRNGKTKLIWFGDKEKTLAYAPQSNEMIITVHRWFANKSCPGDWLYSRLGELATTVTEKLGNSNEATVKTVSVGCTVKVNDGAKTYDGKKLATFVYKREYKVKSLNGNRAVITYNGTTVAAMNVSDLTVV